jgi:hypothetical protein
MSTKAASRMAARLRFGTFYILQDGKGAEAAAA